MNDTFDPHLVQADYLRQVGFRDHLVALLIDIHGLSMKGMLFSEANEAARVDAGRRLVRIFQALGYIEPWMTGFAFTTAGLTTYANLAISDYSLGDPITKKDLGLD